MKKMIIDASLSVLHGLTFTLLLFFRPVIHGGAVIVGALSLLGLIATLIFARGETSAELLFLSVGLLSVGIGFAYNWLLMILAPSGFTMMMED